MKMAKMGLIFVGNVVNSPLFPDFPPQSVKFYLIFSHAPLWCKGFNKKKQLWESFFGTVSWNDDPLGTTGE